MDESIVKFRDIQNITPILTESEYKRLTGLQIVKEEDSFTFSTEPSSLVGNKIQRDKTIKILETADIKTNNSFINEINKLEKEKVQREKQRIAAADLEFPYVKTKLLTDAELQLYNFMKNNLCQVDKLEIFTKVRLADIVNVDEKITTDKSFLWKITNKHVDFLICKADTLDIICVIELDDYTHDTEKAKERDLFVAQVLRTAGIELVRIRTKINTLEKSDLAYADEVINIALAPNCPFCGIKMVPRKSFHFTNRGHRFYGCINYKVNCGYTIDIDPVGEKLP